MILNFRLSKKSNYLSLFTLPVFFLFLVLSSCSSGRTTENKTVEEVYKEALELYTNDDLFEAKKFFDVIKLQYPASSYADDAQFYLADIEFKNKRYIMASFNFNLVKKLYPNSSFVKESQFKNALCYYKLSPGFERDLEYTNKAVVAFTEFQSLYPEDSLAVLASSYVKELRNNLAAREYKTATLYQTLLSPKSAIIYFDSIINDYDDTDFYEKAYVGKIESLIVMSKFEAARTIINLYNAKFPAGKLADKIKDLEISLKDAELSHQNLK